MIFYLFTLNSLTWESSEPPQWKNFNVLKHFLMKTTLSLQNIPQSLIPPGHNMDSPQQIKANGLLLRCPPLHTSLTVSNTDLWLGENNWFTRNPVRKRNWQNQKSNFVSQRINNNCYLVSRVGRTNPSLYPRIKNEAQVCLVDWVGTVPHYWNNWKYLKFFSWTKAETNPAHGMLHSWNISFSSPQ